MDVPETATEALRREHDRILEVVDAFEQVVERAARGEAVWDLVADFIPFFDLFVGACHHGKEEELLFPRLEGEGLSREEGPLVVMLEEHRRGRSLVAEMARVLPAARRGHVGSAAGLAEAARDYVGLIRRHIDKESPAVFDPADRLVTGPACRRLCEAYRSADERQLDGRTTEDLERLAESLLDRARRR